MDQSSYYTLQLLHFGDPEAGLLASQTAPLMGALIDYFDDIYANTLILSGGDNVIPGPFLTAGADPSISDVAAIGSAGRGRPDFAILNAFGTEASTIGNHEFDLGSRAYDEMISPSGDWVGALFPQITANVDFSGDSSLSNNYIDTLSGDTLPEASSLAPGSIVPAAVITEGGERIGLLGATTQRLENISSPTGTTVNGPYEDDMSALAAELQPIIDRMIADGINKIVLMSHLQNLDNERELATLLKGVDIIVGAGSNERIGDADDQAVQFNGHAAEFSDTYPIEITDAAGGTTLLVNTDNEFTYLGRLVVKFDENGNYVPGSYDVAESGAYASSAEIVAKAYGVSVDELESVAFTDGSIGSEVRTITNAVQNVINDKDGTVFGRTDVYLEGERAIVRSQETNLGNLTADANRDAALDALGGDSFVVSIKNGGGIRASIGSVNQEGEEVRPIANPEAGKPLGGVSQLDIENALRFDNKLVVADVTPQGLLNILDYAAGVANNEGAFPQVGGVSYSYDEGAESGARIKNVALIDADGKVLATIVEDGQIVENAPSTISIVTLNFIAGGGDGYPFRDNAENFRFLLQDGTLSDPIDPSIINDAEADLPEAPANALGEQKALGDYLSEKFGSESNAFMGADTPEAEDTRIQNLDLRQDTVLGDAEFRQDLDVFYQAAFNRNAETNGEAFWINANKGQSLTVEQAASFFVTSSEFTDQIDGLSTRDAISLVYQNGFGREAVDAELDYWDDIVEADGFDALLLGFAAVDGIETSIA
ncbi:MAG: 5'-nucleotidase C-terminal domain-containing protein [Pseudomonadota bacterium]|nr:5'-nucleotidase C-terminal domain-containing protein [Pseudomonadota bacterium]